MHIDRCTRQIIFLRCNNRCSVGKGFFCGCLCFQILRGDASQNANLFLFVSYVKCIFQSVIRGTSQRTHPNIIFCPRKVFFHSVRQSSLCTEQVSPAPSPALVSSRRRPTGSAGPSPSSLCGSSIPSGSGGPLQAGRRRRYWGGGGFRKDFDWVRLHLLHDGFGEEAQLEGG